MLSVVIVSLNIVLMIILGLIVYLSDPKNSINRIFLLMTIFTVIWQTCNYLEGGIFNLHISAILLRLDFMAAVFVGYFWHLFSVYFPTLKMSGYSSPLKYFNLALALIFSGLSFSDLIIYGIHFDAGILRFDGGPLWFLYAIVIVYFFAFGVFDMLLKSIRLKGITRIQTIYVLSGFSISAVIALVVNLFFSGVTSVDQSRIGIYGISVFICLTTFSIIKHQLMNIKVIATEIFGFAIVLLSFIDIFSAGSEVQLVFRISIFAVTLIFALMLIRSVLNDVRKREEIELLNLKLSKTTKDLAEANKALKRLDEAKSEFLSISSHQLRTPLTIIKGHSSMLLDGSFGKMSKTVRGSVEKIFISTERLINLVESLLNISRIEAGRIEFNIAPVDLSNVTESMVNDFQQKAKDRGLKLLFASGEKVPEVAADAQKIKDVVSNIIDNAIKYTKKGEIIVGLHQEGQSVVFSSQDTGIGMDSDDIKRLFNKFTRGKDSVKVNTDGTGLGLYYARVLIENMGGRIWVESPGKNKGSKFSFSLPLADKKKAIKIK